MKWLNSGMRSRRKEQAKCTPPKKPKAEKVKEGSVVQHTLQTRDVLGPGPSPKARRPEAIFPGPIRPEKKSSGFRA